MHTAKCNVKTLTNAGRTSSKEPVTLVTAPNTVLFTLDPAAGSSKDLLLGRSLDHVIWQPGSNLPLLIHGKLCFDGWPAGVLSLPRRLLEWE
jgi:hypothetical protein